MYANTDTLGHVCSSEMHNESTVKSEHELRSVNANTNVRHKATNLLCTEVAVHRKNIGHGMEYYSIFRSLLVPLNHQLLHRSLQ